MWKKNEPSTSEPSSVNPPRPAPAAAHNASTERRPPTPSGQRAFIGPTINIQGELSGEEDLVIEGSVEGEISFRKHRVTIGENGRAKADVRGRSVHVEGQVVGNLFGEEEVILHASGSVEGNITAPRVSLENGARFKGSIDMGPKQGQSSPAAPASKTNGNPAGAGHRDAGSDAQKRGAQNAPSAPSQPPAERAPGVKPAGAGRRA